VVGLVEAYSIDSGVSSHHNYSLADDPRMLITRLAIVLQSTNQIPLISNDLSNYAVKSSAERIRSREDYSSNWVSCPSNVRRRSHDAIDRAEDRIVYEHRAYSYVVHTYFISATQSTHIK